MCIDNWRHPTKLALSAFFICPCFLPPLQNQKAKQNGQRQENSITEDVDADIDPGSASQRNKKLNQFGNACYRDAKKTADKNNEPFLLKHFI